MQPIIDVHSHIFNAKDIPLEGYLLSRNYSIKFVKKMIPKIAKCVRRKLAAEIDKNVPNQKDCRLLMCIVKLFMGKHYFAWAKALSEKRTTITTRYWKAFQPDGIHLTVPLMIDYEYWFNNSVDTVLNLQIEQISEEIVKQSEGSIHPFVPFDPARELAFRHGKTNPDGEPEEYGSLALVKTAIKKSGFIGVKLYNAMGYRPYNNAKVETERKKIPMHKHMYSFHGDQYDEVLSELYQYCVDNEVPITTHCNMYGSESYPDASFDFGKAIYWREVLEQPRFKKLHLNLAHFGWDPKKGYFGERHWIKDICDMMNEFDHLYTDVSHHRVVKKRQSKKIVNAYQEIIQKYPIVKQRLIFGIDWHVIIRMKNHTSFKKKYIEVLEQIDDFRNDDIGRFLGENAIRFLHLTKNGGNRKRLEEYYNENRITYPEWFRSTSQIT